MIIKWFLKSKPPAKYIFFLKQQWFNFAQAEVRAVGSPGNPATW